MRFIGTSLELLRILHVPPLDLLQLFGRRFSAQGPVYYVLIHLSLKFVFVYVFYHLNAWRGGVYRLFCK